MNMKCFRRTAIIALIACSTFITADHQGNLRQRGAREQVDPDEENPYKLAPQDIPESKYKEFFVGPAVDPPKARDENKEVPRELSDDPHDKSWVFKGYKRNLSDEEADAREAKIKAVDEYFDSLDDSEREELEDAIDEFVRKEERKNAAENKRQKSADDREEIAVGILKNGEVWALRSSMPDRRSSLQSGDFFPGANNATTNDAKDEEGYDGDDDSRPPKERELHGSTLKLRSSHNGYNMYAYPQRVHGCVTSRNYPHSCCSGTKISARLVLSAGHCFTENKDFKGRDKWIPGVDGVGHDLDGSNETPQGVRTSVAIFVPKKWYDYNWSSYDMALLVLRGTQSNCNLGWFGYKKEYFLTGKWVSTWGVPSGTCPDSPLSGDACGNSIYGNGEKVYAVGASNFRYHIDTQGGMSGAAVYRSNRAVGVHIEGVGIGRRHGRACRINNGKLGFINEIRGRYPDSTACS